ncbi:MAG: hypothetical protein JWN04_5145, partial [Myxococcaceae bacterium]|nr:hypothetical protein [Myxococcaceae bacterium]
MRFLMMYHPETDAPPSPEQMMALGKFSEKMTSSGILVDTGGLLPSSKGARVR